MIESADQWELTANQYVALPMIARADGSIQSLNVLQRAALGLIQWSGAENEPLFRPELEIDGVAQPLAELHWERLERWIPRFRLRTPTVSITATLCAPTGYDASRRGLFYHFEIENLDRTEHGVRIVMRGCWAGAERIVGAARPLRGERILDARGARPGIALELAGPSSVALGLAVFGADSVHETDGRDPSVGEQQLGFQERGRFHAARVVRVAAGRRGAITFYFGVAAEREGALATAYAMRRLGAERLLKDTRLDLSRIARKVRDPALGAVFNRNLIFACFFGVARGIDDERLYPLSTRSPLHPACATFNERAGLLYVLPALLLADPPLARELLLRCFEQYSHRPGEAVRYIDGGVKEPGFALDQWCAYVLATATYVESTGDAGLLDEPLVADVLRELETGIYTRLHPEVFLAESELLPSGDAADYPFVTFGNALLHSSFKALARLRGEDSEEGRRSTAAADEVAAAIWRRCVVEVSGLPILASSTDLAEDASIYDDPAGSLQLLPHYNFCDTSEPVWRNTVEFLRSSSYPLWLGERTYPGLASRSQPALPGLAALCADLLGIRRTEALAVLRTLDLAAGVAATHYDADTGKPAGSPFDAGLAGFLATSLHHALNA